MRLHFIVNFYLWSRWKCVNLRFLAPYNNNEIIIRKRRVGIAAENVDCEYNYVEAYESYHLFLRPLQHAMFQLSAYKTQRCLKHVNSWLRTLLSIRTLNYFRCVHGDSKRLEKKKTGEYFIESNTTVHCEKEVLLFPYYTLYSTCTRSCGRIPSSRTGGISNSPIRARRGTGRFIIPYAPRNY